MMKSKGVLAAGCLAGALVLIYGTAALFGLLTGNYLFEGGLASLNYPLLAILCAAPFVLVALIGRNNKGARQSVMLAAVLFTVLFMLIHLVLAQSAGTLDTAAVVRMLVIFPVSALLLAGTVYIAWGRKQSF